MKEKLTKREQLIELRKAIAQKNGQATYLVYNDSELEVLLQKQPKTIEELAAIKGFPKNGKRVAAYGNALVSIFNEKPSGKIVGQSIKSSSIFGK